MDTPPPTASESRESPSMEENSPDQSPVEAENAEYNITLFEACEKLNKSRKTVSRYVRRGLLHPIKVRSQQGTLEYRFSQRDLDDFKSGQGRQDRQDRQDTEDETGQIAQNKDSPVLDIRTVETGQDMIDRTEQTGTLPENSDFAILKEKPDETGQDTGDETGNAQIINLLKETTTTLKEQLGIKDTQIEMLNNTVDKMVERNRELNILLKGEQDRALRLAPPVKKTSKKALRGTPVTNVPGGTEETGQAGQTQASSLSGVTADETSENPENNKDGTGTGVRGEPEETKRKSWWDTLMGN